MIIPDWNPKVESWDRYNAFHIGVGIGGLTTTGSYAYPEFILFDTGEVICTFIEPRPDNRGHFPLLNLDLIATDNNKLAFHAPDGELVPHAWLNERGMQYAVVDRCTGRVTRLAGRNDTDYLTQLPERFKTNAKAYFPGPGRTCIGVPFEVHKPLRKGLTPEEYKHCDGMLTSLRMVAKLVPDHVANTADPARKYYDPLPTGIAPSRLLEASSINDLTDNEQRGLLRRGISRPIVMMDYLTVKIS